MLTNAISYFHWNGQKWIDIEPIRLNHHRSHRYIYMIWFEIHMWVLQRKFIFLFDWTKIIHIESTDPMIIIGCIDASKWHAMIHDLYICIYIYETKRLYVCVTQARWTNLNSWRCCQVSGAICKVYPIKRVQVDTYTQ